VPFEVVPAVDVAGGRLARLTHEGPAPVEDFGGDPVAAARAFIGEGAGRLHVVDMDRALGSGENVEVLARIADLGVPVQASGGIATTDDARRALDRGAGRVVLSSRALADRDAFERLVEGLAAAVVVGLELDGPRIRPRGVASDTAVIDLDVMETTAWLAETDAPRYLVTDLGRLGSASGPDLVHIRWLAMTLGRPLLVAGGIATAEDVRALTSLGPPLEGAVVGSALYGGGASLKDLLEAARA
jgi:phosphoribosyl isomerase A